MDSQYTEDVLSTLKANTYICVPIKVFICIYIHLGSDHKISVSKNIFKYLFFVI